jgi:Na+/H+-dicarboxylate symporter
MITYTKFFSSFLVGIASLWVVLLFVGYIFLRKHLFTLLKRIMSPLVIAFGTTSSEAVFPKLTEELERFGIKDRIVSFMLPLGYSFNLDGSMMYMTFASIFIAQVYGVPLDTGTQLTMLLVLMLTSFHGFSPHNRLQRHHKNLRRLQSDDHKSCDLTSDNQPQRPTA